jgi:peptide/nickel transport system permease protein
MTGYVARRLLGAIPLLLAVATLIFLVLDLAPGDPAAMYFHPNIPQEVIEQLRRNLGLDQPLGTRYVKWLGSFVQGDFGYSFYQSRPVADVIADALPNTLLLAAVALVAMFFIGIVVGVLQAVRQHGWADRTLSVLGLFFYSMPSFWLGLMLMLLFSLKAHQWGWPIALPATGITSADYEFLSTWGKLGDRAAHLVLPATTLILVLSAGVARYTRGQMLEVIHQDYIRTARAKGLPERTVVLKHALRNSVIPVVTLAGLYLPLLFSGTVFVETIFSWPGMGRVIFDAISQRDTPVILATSFIFATLVVFGNLMADILYAVVDPRIRYD